MARESFATTSHRFGDHQTGVSDSTGTGRLGVNYARLFASSFISNLGDGIGTIAYPWLASAVTRNPFLISLVVVVQRLPWLLFSLPAGVITDRVDRFTLMVRANVLRALLTLGVSVAVFSQRDSLPSVDEVAALGDDLQTNHLLFLIILLATFLLGIGEVLYDNAAQTSIPTIVEEELLEKANGRMWSSEMVANTFIGPPLGALLLAAAFALPFLVDATSFFVAAALIMLIARNRPAREVPDAPARSWKVEMREGFDWLRSHELLYPLAIILGVLNMLGIVPFTIMVLFAQEVLDTTPTEFAIMSTGGAVGGVIGGWSASWISKKLGPAPSLWLTIGTAIFAVFFMGIANSWPLVWVMGVFFTWTAMLWNVITVSLRQAIIPDELLGRVNSVYRFFAWGAMPVGAALTGVIVTVADGPLSRESALRLPFFVSAALLIVLLVFASRILTTERIEAARASAQPKAL
jgi:MFS family permease